MIINGMHDLIRKTGYTMKTIESTNNGLTRKLTAVRHSHLGDDSTLTITWPVDHSYFMNGALVVDDDYCINVSIDSDLPSAKSVSCKKLSLGSLVMVTSH